MGPLAALMLIVSAFGCDRGPTDAGYAPAPRLDGTWRWVSSRDVRSQALHTPATAGFEATLKLEATGAREGTFTYTRGDQPPVTGRFGIGSEDAPGNDFITLEPGIDFLTRTAWVGVARDSLRLDGVFESGFLSMYARVQR